MLSWIRKGSGLLRRRWSCEQLEMGCIFFLGQSLLNERKSGFVASIEELGFIQSIGELVGWRLLCGVFFFDLRGWRK